MTQRLALIIEDHVDLAEIYKITLDMVGYTTELVTDGKVALDKLADITPDLVILDMNLPQVSGHYIYKKMRSNPAWSNIPIIISTANTIVCQRPRRRDHRRGSNCGQARQPTQAQRNHYRHRC